MALWKESLTFASVILVTWLISGIVFDMQRPPDYETIIIYPGNYNLAVVGLWSAVHSEQISIQDPGITHAQTLYSQQIMSTWTKQSRVESIMILDMLFGKYGIASCNPSYNRQARFLSLGQKPYSP